MSLRGAFDSMSQRSVSGTKTLGFQPNVVPEKPSGATPTIVSVWPFTTSACPTTLGSPPSELCQYS